MQSEIAAKTYVRPVVVCLFSYKDRILVCEAYDKKRDIVYYRSLGGGIEFQETIVDALRREIFEEIGARICNERYLGFYENIFELEGEPRHELMFVYDADFADTTVYKNETIEIKESGWNDAVWKHKDEFGDGKLILYPTGVLDLL